MWLIEKSRTSELEGPLDVQDSEPPLHKLGDGGPEGKGLAPGQRARKERLEDSNLGLRDRVGKVNTSLLRCDLDH